MASTYPYWLDFVHCGMFIGGEKWLLRESEATLMVPSKVPMASIEKCIVNREQIRAKACQMTLQQIDNIMCSKRSFSGFIVTFVDKNSSAERLENPYLPTPVTIS